MRVRTGADEASVVGVLAEGAADGGHAEGWLDLLQVSVNVRLSDVTAASLFYNDMQMCILLFCESKYTILHIILNFAYKRMLLDLDL